MTTFLLMVIPPIAGALAIICGLIVFCLSIIASVDRDASENHFGTGEGY